MGVTIRHASQRRLHHSSVPARLGRMPHRRYDPGGLHPVSAKSSLWSMLGGTSGSVGSFTTSAMMSNQAKPAAVALAIEQGAPSELFLYSLKTGRINSLTIRKILDADISPLGSVNPVGWL